MVFSSLVFLLFFLPALLLFYYGIPRRRRGWRNGILLAFSLLFYYWGANRLIWLMLASIGIHYLGGCWAGQREHPKLARLGLIVTVGASLALLGWFKYAGFFAEVVRDLGFLVPIPQVTLPIGISFFTFQGLSYVIDVYRGDAPIQKNPLYVALYLALFPQLVAGPIVRYTTVMEEITDRKETLDGVAQGGVRFSFGLAKKMVLANAMGQIADAIFQQNPKALDPGLAWLGAVAYTLQIYLDFSAYSDMAIGLGEMFGFHFLENFRYPYVARSVTDFWRRWHISLSTWFRDYVYIPLGGNRCSPWRHIRNFCIVWLLTGLWHGAAWGFVVWGLWFCVLLLGERYLLGRWLEKLPAVAAHSWTMLAVLISWVWFRCGQLSQGMAYLGAMVGWTTGGSQDGQVLYYLLQFWPEWILSLAACLPLRPWLLQWLERRGSQGRRVILWGSRFGALVMLMVSYLELMTGSFNPFIYFQF